MFSSEKTESGNESKSRDYNAEGEGELVPRLRVRYTRDLQLVTRNGLCKNPTPL